MNDYITATGVVATTPRTLTTSEGLTITSFRFATIQRKRLTGSDQVREETHWYTVTCFRRLAQNVRASINKGDHVIVAGSLRIREWQTDEKSGTSVEIEANNLGPDLVFGATTYEKTAVDAPALGEVSRVEAQPF